MLLNKIYFSSEFLSFSHGYSMGHVGRVSSRILNYLGGGGSWSVYRSSFYDSLWAREREREMVVRGRSEREGWLSYVLAKYGLEIMMVRRPEHPPHKHTFHTPSPPPSITCVTSLLTHLAFGQTRTHDRQTNGQTDGTLCTRLLRVIMHDFGTGIL